MITNAAYTFFFKRIFLLMALFSALIGVMGYFFPDFIRVNGEPTDFDLIDYAIIGGITIIGIILQRIFGPHFVNARVGGQNITILDYEPAEVINWMDVKSISKLWFVFPPLYKLKVKNSDSYYLFTSKSTTSDTEAGSADLSSMSILINRKKKELKI